MFLMQLRRNITIGYFFCFFQMFLVIIPVLIPYWQTLGLSVAETIQIQAIFGISVALFEVPTGYVADVFSRKISVCLGSAISGIGFSMMPWASTFSELAMMEIILALGGSLISGADFSIIYDSIRDDKQKLKVISVIESASLFGEALAAIVCALLMFHSFKAVVWAQVTVGWLPFIFSLFFIEPPIERMKSKNPFANLKEVLQHVFISDKLLRLIFINSVIWGLSSFSVVWLLQPYWQGEGVSLTYFGYMWAGLMLTAALVSQSIHRLEKRLGAVTLFYLLAVTCITGYLLMGLIGGMAGVTSAMLFYICRGISTVMFKDAMQWRVPSKFRSTVSSLNSLAFRLGFGIFGPLIAFAIQHIGLKNTLALMGGIFTALLLLLLMPMIREMQLKEVKSIPEVSNN